MPTIQSQPEVGTVTGTEVALTDDGATTRKITLSKIKTYIKS